MSHDLLYLDLRHFNQTFLDLDLWDLNQLLHCLHFNAWHLFGDMLDLWNHDPLLNLTHLDLWHFDDPFSDLYGWGNLCVRGRPS
jgi:hypothetical protein